MSSRRPPKKNNTGKNAPPLRLLNPSAQAKRMRALMNAGALLLGLILGAILHLKRFLAKDLLFAIKYGTAPLDQSLQVVRMRSDYFQASPSRHVLDVNGLVYNHSAQPKTSPQLMLTVLSPTGELIKQFSAEACKTEPLPPEGSGKFFAQVDFEHAGLVGSYFLSEDTRVPSRTEGP